MVIYTFFIRLSAGKRARPTHKNAKIIFKGPFLLTLFDHRKAKNKVLYKFFIRFKYICNEFIGNGT